MSPKTPIGNWHSEIWLKTTDPSLPRIRVPLSVEVEPAAGPTKVSFGEVKVGAEADRPFVVTGDKPFRITEIKGSDEQLIVKDAQDAPAVQHTLTLILKGVKPGEVSRLIKIRTDVKDQEPIVFDANGKVIP